MADSTEARRNPWLYGQDGPPPGPPRPAAGPGPWAAGPSAGAPVHVEPAALHRAAEVSRRLQGELRQAVGHAAPDTGAAAQALGAHGFGSGAALGQVLTWWTARWNSLDTRLGLTADRLEATGTAYRSTETSAAIAFKAP
ncbi:hypothetical protein ACIPYS_32500 [Kitasatospora sp. NPDC089913]|uniref:hypothetical protein n=1 Tax=Kitasatospora sp. NPDC089913 TaxID=3364080 RepID=UPI0037FB255F